MKRSDRISMTVFLCAVLFFTFAYATPHRRSSFNVLAINDIHLNSDKDTPMKLDPSSRERGNDMDPKTLSALINTMSQYNKIRSLNENDRVLLLGDLVGHGAWLFRQHYVIKSEAEVFSWLPSVFSRTDLSHRPQWYYQFGNNDSMDADYGPFSAGSSDTNPWQIAARQHVSLGGHWTQDVFPAPAKQCLSKNPKAPCLMESKPLIKGEQYGLSMAYIKKRLVVINFNDIPLSARATSEASANAGKVLQWLQAALRLVHHNGFQAIIVTHIPFGNNIYDNSPFLKANYGAHLIALLHQYHRDIVVVLAAHTHMNEFKVLQHHHHAELLELISPALSTSHGNAASFSIYHLTQDKKSKWQLMNMTTYRFDQHGVIKPVMNMHQAYGCHRGAVLTQCILNKAKDPKQFFDQVEAYYLDGNPNITSPNFSAKQLSNLIVNF